MNKTESAAIDGIRRVGNNTISLDFFEETGDIYELNTDATGITSTSGNMLDPYSCINFFLGNNENRIPLLGHKNTKYAGFDNDYVLWKGLSGKLDYEITFRPDPNQSCWFWIVKLSNNSRVHIKTDVVYYMDKGLAPRNVLKANEIYNSHYIDITELHDPEYGILLASRQNLDVINNRVPWLIEGCFHGCRAFATDGEDFFGSQYRLNGIPEAAMDEDLPSNLRQGQFAITALQSRNIELSPDETKEIVFWGMYKDKHIDKSSDEDLKLSRECLRRYNSLRPVEKNNNTEISPATNIFSEPLSGNDLNGEQLESLLGPQRLFPEYGPDGKLWSFFQDSKHIVLREKDKYMNIQNGHIMRSGSGLFHDDELLSLNCYMNGCFASQMSIGNSYFNSFITHPRTIHDLLRANGIRIAVDTGKGFKILSVPSAYIMSHNKVEWIYRLEDTMIMITAETAVDMPLYRLSARTQENKPVRFLFLIFLNYQEDNNSFYPSIDLSEKNRVKINPHKKSLFANSFSGVSIIIEADKTNECDIESVKTDTDFLNGYKLVNMPLVAMETKNTDLFSISVSCKFPEESSLILRNNVGGDLKDFLNTPYATSKSPETAKLLNKINITSRWFASNALIHFSVMHGLEQSKGAAWGVRDVLQGPFEAFLAKENWQALREIIKLVFTEQDKDDGTWPQWFMLDAYHTIRDKHANGDIIFWPVKAICEYIEESNDLRILDEHIVFTSKTDLRRTDKSESIADHLLMILKTIEDNCLIKDSGYLWYGGGDWNDTLQPCNAERKECLVSIWTMGLAQQYLLRLKVITAKSNHKVLYNKLVKLTEKIGTEITNLTELFFPVPGFVILDNGVKPFIHPEDGITNLSFRLLPMIRFINAGFFTEETARNHLKIIEDNLWHPDGVKLLDRPIEYHQGHSMYFIRAEQSAFWGREVGLMYVHAHLRFIEALLALGEADKAWKAINQIIPVNIKDTVPNAAARQSNAYFSSSDSGFLNRNDAENNYSSIINGTIPCNGGWRIYSSGPGIFLSLIKRWFFGYRYNFDSVILDPVIPSSLSGCCFNFEAFDKKVMSLRVFSEQGACFGVKKLEINGERIDFENVKHPYRNGGAVINKEYFKSLLVKSKNNITVYL